MSITEAAIAGNEWPITNCYVDAWMPILSDWGLEPLAGLGFTAALDYEADQFTFFKYLHDDLELLYGIVAGELTVYQSLEAQVAKQTSRNRLVLVEADGYYLPDTRATSYRTQHIKTTIGIDRIDIRTGSLSYYHNGGHHDLSGTDYLGIFPRQSSHQTLPPYVEFIKRRYVPLAGCRLTEAARNLLRRHLGRRPERSPIQAYRTDFSGHMDWLLANPQSFHDYAFAIFRQLGANFELLAKHLDWLRARGVGGMDAADEAARAISSDAKAMQFKVARMVARQRFDACEMLFDRLERSYTAMNASIEQAVA